MKLRLLREYANSTETYYRRLHELREKTPVSTKAAYESLKAAVERARDDSETARVVLESHIQQHNC